MANNRVSPDVNFTEIAAQLDGYTGSDIKEVCREAVTRISNEMAERLETDSGRTGDDAARGGEASDGLLQVLRPVEMRDFRAAMAKLSASVSPSQSLR